MANIRREVKKIDLKNESFNMILRDEKVSDLRVKLTSENDEERAESR